MKSRLQQAIDRTLSQIRLPPRERVFVAAGLREEMRRLVRDAVTHFTDGCGDADDYLDTVPPDYNFRFVHKRVPSEWFAPLIIDELPAVKLTAGRSVLDPQWELHAQGPFQWFVVEDKKTRDYIRVLCRSWGEALAEGLKAGLNNVEAKPI